MRPVRREELVDYETYREGRNQSRPRVLGLKEARRVHVGSWLTFLFENTDTVRYQVQEMMLTERMVKEADIAHELSTYNELLGKPGEFGATLLIEIESAEERAVKLQQWLALPQHLYLELDDGTKIRAQVDARQISDGRLSSVHYLKFDTHGRLPKAIGCDLPDIDARAVLTAEQLAALAADLASDH